MQNTLNVWIKKIKEKMRLNDTDADTHVTTDKTGKCTDNVKILFCCQKLTKIMECILYSVH